MKKHYDDSMNPKWILSGIVFIVIFTLIHFIFEGVIRPNAESLLQQGSGTSLNIFVILKDIEQQLCISAAIYCLFLMAYKFYRLLDEESFYTRDFLQGDAEEQLDVDAAITTLQGSANSENAAMSTWINCLKRYKNTANVQHASDAIAASVEALSMQLESGNNMIRYIIWAIPSIGFVGTVRGIGQALAQADDALAGDISGMTASLGVAFNSTFVALLVSLLLMLLLHILQSRQDQMVINTQRSCEKNLLARLHQ